MIKEQLSEPCAGKDEEDASRTLLLLRKGGEKRKPDNDAAQPRKACNTVSGKFGFKLLIPSYLLSIFTAKDDKSCQGKKIDDPMIGGATSAPQDYSKKVPSYYFYKIEICGRIVLICKTFLNVTQLDDQILEMIKKMSTEDEVTIEELLALEDSLMRSFPCSLARLATIMQKAATRIEGKCDHDKPLDLSKSKLRLSSTLMFFRGGRTQSLSDDNFRTVQDEKDVEKKKLLPAAFNRELARGKKYQNMMRVKCMHGNSMYENVKYFNKVDLSARSSLTFNADLCDPPDPRSNFGGSDYTGVTTLNLLSWNLEGYESKIETLRSLLNFTSVDIACLQESYLNMSRGCELKNEIHNYTMTSQSKDRYLKCREAISGYKNPHGVATLLSNDLARRCKFLESNNDRILCQKIEFGRRTLMVINFYQYTMKSGLLHQRQFEECLSIIAGLLTEHQGKNTSFIILSDLNSCPVKHTDKKRAKAMADFLKTIGGQYYLPDTPSFTSHRGSVSWLDGVITSRDIDVNTLLTLDNEYFPESTSTHSPILTQISFKSSLNETTEKKINQKDGSPFRAFKKVLWKNIHMEVYKRLSTFLVKGVMEVLEDCPWQIKANAFMSCLARAAELSTLEGGSNEDISEKSENERLVKLKTEKKMVYLKIKDLRKILRRRYDEDRIFAVKKMHREDSQVMQLLEEERKKAELNKSMRRIERNLSNKKEKMRLENLNQQLEKANSRDFYKVLKSYQGKVADDFPDSLLVEGRLYTGEEVLNGFKQMAFSQSRKEKMFEKDVPHEFLMIKKFNILYEKIAKNDDQIIARLPDEDIMKEVKKVKNGKAPDLLNVGKENITHAEKYVQSTFCEFVNDMITDPKKYSASLASTSVASFLFKGKDKCRLDPTSYRKISIGSFYNKIVDKVFSEETQSLAKQNQPPLQYGFTAGVNFLLCSILRESVIRKAVKEGKRPVLLACDVKNAFSKTSRVCQLYELYQAGERSKIWLYSKATYSNTWTVIKRAKNYSDLLEELCGSKQGGVKSAVDYKSYNSPLYRLIDWSGLGLEVKKKRYGSIICADDALSITGSVPAMKGIIELYHYFANIYSVDYCIKKTIVNTFGTKDDKEALMNSDLTIGGVRPLFDEDSVHLGLWLSENLKKVVELNVSNRIKKTDNKLFGSLRSVIWDKTGHSNLETKIKLYTTLLRPSLLSGLNALCVEGQQLQRLKEWEEWILRKIFGLKDIASVYGTYMNSHLLPIEGHLHKSVLSLFFNAWQNRRNPVVEVIKYTMDEKDGEGFWGTYLKRICEKYRLPDPKKMLEEECPSKSSWKKMVNERVSAYYISELRLKRKRMRTLELMQQEITLDGRLEKSLCSRYPGSNATIKTINELLTGEFVNQDWLRRHRKEESDVCLLCDKEREDVTHILTNCDVINSDPEVSSRRRRLSEVWKRGNLAFTENKCTAAAILDPLTHLNSRQQELMTETVTVSRSLVQSIIFTREQRLFQVKKDVGSSRGSKDSEKEYDPSEYPECSSQKTGRRNRSAPNGEVSQQSITQFLRDFKTKDRVPGQNPNLNVADQMICAMMCPGVSVVIGALCTEFGRIVMFRQVISEHQEEASFNNALVVLFEDAEILLATRTAILRTLNQKNSAKVLKILKKRCKGNAHSYLSQISELAPYLCWPQALKDDIYSTWHGSAKWPSRGVEKFGQDRSTTPSPVVVIWINDAPLLDVIHMDQNELVTEIFVKRRDFVSDGKINIIDGRRMMNPQNYVGPSKMYLDLNEDLTKIDNNVTVRCMPRDSSGIDDILELDEIWDNIHEGRSTLREWDMTEVVTVPGAIHMARLPTGVIWRGRDLATRFMKLALTKANNKAIDVEPISRHQLHRYEKDLVAIEEHVLGGPEDAHEDEVLAGFNVDQNGRRIVFKTVTSVRTESTHIPERNVITLDPEEVKKMGAFEKTIRNYHDENDAPFNDFKFQKFGGDRKIVKTEFEYVEHADDGKIIKREPVECITHKNQLYTVMNSVSDSDTKTEPLTPMVTPVKKRKDINSKRRGSKRKWEGNDASDSEVTIESPAPSTDESDGEMDDISDPETTIRLMMRIKDAKGARLTHSYQREVKRLKHFNRRPLLRLAEKKLKLAARLSNTDDLMTIVNKVKTSIPPKTGEETEPLRKKMKTATTSRAPPPTQATPNTKAAEERKKDDPVDEAEMDEFNRILDSYEAEVAPDGIQGLKPAEADIVNGNAPAKSGPATTESKDEAPTKELPKENIGKNMLDTSACFIVVLVSRGTICPDLKPPTLKHSTLDCIFTGRISLQIIYFMYIMINILFRLVDDDAGTDLHSDVKAKSPTCFYQQTSNGFLV